MNNRPSVIQRLISSVLCVAIALPNVVYAQASNDLSVIGRDGQAFGRELLQDFLGNQPTLEGNNLNLPGTQDGPLNITDLFPGSSGTYSGGAVFFPDGYSTDVDEYTGLHDSGSAMDSSGSAAQGVLWDDAIQDDPVSIQGQAYKVILDTANRSRPDMREDPIFRQSRDVMEDIGDWQKEFGDCSTENTFVTGGRTVHVPEYERCERVQKPHGECTIRHDMDIEPHVFDVFAAGRGRNVLTMQFDLKSGIWRQISPSDGISFAGNVPTLDYESLCSDAKASQTQLVGSWDWLSHGLGGKVDSTVIYSVNQYPTCENGLVGTVQIRDTNSSSDTDYILAGKFTFNLAILYDDAWTTEECATAATAVTDGFCQGTVTEVSGPKPPPSSDDPENPPSPDDWKNVGCLYTAGLHICPGSPIYNQLTPAPAPQLDTLTTEAYVSKLQCNFNVGDMECYEDSQGELQCPHNEGNELSTCQEFESNPQCGYISSTCVKGAEGPGGECYVYEDTFDCGYSTEIGTIEKQVEIQCAGPIRCMGTDCLDIEHTQNNDFAKASALLNAAQFMAQDMQCSEGATEEGGDGNPDIGCTVFPGEAGECKKAVGGVVNCCEKPDGISLMDYVNLLMAVPKIDTAIMGLSETNTIRSSYQMLREPITQGFTELSKPFTSALDGVSGAMDTVSQAYDQVVGLLEDSVAKLYDQVFGNIAEGAGTVVGDVATGAASEAAQEFVANVGNLIGWVGTIYTVYTVAMMAIKMIWKCTDDEMAVNVKRQLKSCSYVGSYCKTEVLGVCIEKREAYCCFSSPLSRIIQEQIRPQLGLSFGDPESPTCGGIGMEQIADIDWEKVNLDEWLGILESTGNWPNPEEIDITSLTGAGTTFDLGSRADAEQRAMERMEGTDIDQARYDQSVNYQPFMGGTATP